MVVDFWEEKKSQPTKSELSFSTCSKWTNLTIIHWKKTNKRIYFCDKSQFGTFINGIRIDKLDLAEGDVISLVNDSNGPDQHLISEFKYILRKTKYSNEIITIDTSDDENDKKDVIPQTNNKFNDDYEIGEPSGTPSQPSRSISPYRNDPVSRVRF